jgi:hypothetical protein
VDITGIVAGIDQEIARLSEARDLLAGQPNGKKRRGRPIGSVAKTSMSAAGRARLSAAMKARWAKRKAVGTKKAA